SLIASSLACRTAPLLWLVSPLAEGADRIIAEEAIQEPGASLEAILPLAPDDYETDFKTAESRAEFRKLLAKANQVRIVPPGNSRDESYEAAARLMVDHCD